MYFFSKSLLSGPGYEIIVKCEGAAVSGWRKSPSNELVHPWPPALRSKAQRAHWLLNANAMTYNRVFQRKQNESVSDHECWVMYMNPCQTTTGVTRPELKGAVASNLFWKVQKNIMKAIEVKVFLSVSLPESQRPVLLLSRWRFSLWAIRIVHLSVSRGILLLQNIRTASSRNIR